jgi:hypothetical protein
MNFEERRRFHLPSFKTHISAHEEVLSNELWFKDGNPYLGKQFTARKAKVRKAAIMDLLFRTAKQQRRVGNACVSFEPGVSGADGSGSSGLERNRGARLIPELCQIGRYRKPQA